MAERCSEQCPTEEQHSLFIVRIIIDHYELLRITTPYSTTTTTIYSASRVPHFIHSFSRHLIFPIDKPPNNHLDLLSFQSQPGKCFASLAAPAGYTLYVKTAENKKRKKKNQKGFQRGTKKSSKMSFRPTQAQLNLAALASPSPSPRSKRTLRKIQSYQGLSSNPNSNSTSGQRSHPSAAAEDLHQTTQQQRQRQLDSPPQFRTHRQVRSNSDAGAREAAVAAGTQTQRRPARKTGSGFGVKRSVLESFLRDGPQNGDMVEGLQELRYLVLSSRVEADADGMVSSFTGI